MSEKSEITINNNNFEVFNIKKYQINHLPYSLRVLMENYLRNESDNIMFDSIIEKFTKWNGSADANTELTFYPSRVIMQDFTGVPAVVDLASMRDAMTSLDESKADAVNPQCQTDLVIDHSVMVDHFGTSDSKDLNTKLEYERNTERYKLLKWGQQAFKNLRIVPPNNGIIHQINIEYIARVIYEKEGQLYPDTVVGTDSHTTMVNGLGVLGWGVGGIEAEAAMLGQPIPMLLPEVIGFELTGKLGQTTTATDLVLTIVQMLREKNVVGKFVEFYGSGLDNLSIADRCTISNMAPEYGATCGFFPVDALTIDYLKITGKDEDHLAVVEEYSKACGFFRDDSQDIKYTDSLSLDMGDVEACLSGPKRPQDRVLLSDVKDVSEREIKKLKKSPNSDGGINDGNILIAAITSCTNTSNPSVILGAGLLAKRAVERGLATKEWVKTSLAPGSRVVENYLKKANLLDSLNKLGFNIVGYGCTTCIGNSGPLDNEYVKEINDRDLVVSSILSGNRNFEGRIHPEIKMNFLASPMLVVAYSLVGKINVDISTTSLGKDSNGNDVYLKDIWPSNDEINEVMSKTIDGEMFNQSYKNLFEGDSNWMSIPTSDSDRFDWDEKSTYIQPSPFFGKEKDDQEKLPAIEDAYPLVILGDSVTTDHISPAGSFKDTTPAGKHLIDNSVNIKDFNSYGSRRGNFKIMQRGTFANIRLSNKLVPEKTGGYTKLLPEGKEMSIYDAAQEYKKSDTNLIIFAGKDYGCGSSRDWAAKGTKLLGVKAVIAESFERIHRSNLVGMGIMPLQFNDDDSFEVLGLSMNSSFDIAEIKKDADTVTITERESGKSFEAKVRIDTAKEWEYFVSDGILNYVLKKLAN
jgi:aconitate hydratase